MQRIKSGRWILAVVGAAGLLALAAGCKSNTPAPPGGGSTTNGTTGQAGGAANGSNTIPNAGQGSEGRPQ